jgi:hypothetical protein
MDGSLGPPTYLRCASHCDDPAQWQSLNLAFTPGLDVALAVSDVGKVVVVWGAKDSWKSLYYSECVAENCAQSSAWSAPTFAFGTPTELGTFVDFLWVGHRGLVFDAAGRLHFAVGISGLDEAVVYATCSAECGNSQSWSVTTLARTKMPMSLSIAVSGSKVAIAGVVVDEGLSYYECDGQCTSLTNWRHAIGMHPAKANGGVSLALQGGLPRVAFRDADGQPVLLGCAVNCSNSASWSGVVWNGQTSTRDETIALLISPQGRFTLALADEKALEIAVMTCSTGCATAGSSWTRRAADDSNFVTEESHVLPTDCPAEHPIPYAYSVVNFGLSMVSDGSQLFLLANAYDLKGCEGTNEYSVFRNYRGRYIRLPAQ